ncbi:MAG TPA: hypothetical protein VFO16_02445 [Pseudonocardiaceae bacterium]|nr:hypothetical protein [Pseudonocardiaceae bacterium]
MAELLEVVALDPGFAGAVGLDIGAFGGVTTPGSDGPFSNVCSSCRWRTMSSAWP